MIFKTVKGIVRSRPVEIAYKFCKGAIVGVPMYRQCVMELKECIYSVSTTGILKRVSVATAVHVLPFPVVACVSLVNDMVESKRVVNVTTFIANAVCVPVTAPLWGVDKLMAPIEMVVFGKTLPIFNSTYQWPINLPK